MANPISNDDDYNTPDRIDEDVLSSKDTDYNNDDIVDNDIVNDDSVDNNIAGNDRTDMPSSTPALSDEDFDEITTDNGSE